MNFRRDIEGLRGVAVLAVVLFHLDVPGFSGGFVGVDIFFVISGYLITSILIRDIERNTFSFSGFISRRIKRLFPALFAVLSACCCIAFFVLIPSDMRDFAESALSAALSYSNFYFESKVDYFADPSIERPLLNIWSLAVEEQFYLIWPLILAATYSKISRARLIHIIFVLCAISLFIAEWKVQHGSTTAFYLLPGRAWELLLGAALSIAALPTLNSVAQTATRWLGIGLILFSIVFFSEATSFPGLAAVIPCMGAALVIYAGSGSMDRDIGNVLLSSPPMRFTGRISYSLYLVHWPLISFVTLWVNDTLTVEIRTLLFVVSLAMAYGLWRFVEVPFRYAEFSTKKAFVGAGAAVLPIVAYFGLSQATAGMQFRVSDEVRIADAANFERKVRNKVHDCKKITVGETNGSECHFGVTSEKSTIVVWGDSHTGHLLPGLATMVRHTGTPIIAYFRPGCAPVTNLTRVTKGKNGPVRDCAVWNEFILDKIKASNNVVKVLLASRWAHYTEPNPQVPYLLIDAASLDRYEAETKKVFASNLRVTLDNLTSSGKDVLIIGQIPEFTRHVADCVARAKMFRRSSENCSLRSRSDYSERYAFTTSEFRKLDQELQKVSFFDPFDTFCDVKSCYAARDNITFYRDDDHLSASGAQLLIDSVFRYALQKAL